jgi:hypothetical protein
VTSIAAFNLLSLFCIFNILITSWSGSFVVMSVGCL